MHNSFCWFYLARRTSANCFHCLLCKFTRTTSIFLRTHASLRATALGYRTRPPLDTERVGKQVDA